MYITHNLHVETKNFKMVPVKCGTAMYMNKKWRHDSYYHRKWGLNVPSSILNEAVCISLCTDVLGKKHESFSSNSNCDLFRFGMATSHLGEEKLN